MPMFWSTASRLSLLITSFSLTATLNSFYNYTNSPRVYSSSKGMCLAR